MTPVLWTECEDDFGIADLDRRLHHGGLPEFLLGAKKDKTLCPEWMESFHARDIQELFAVRERPGFLNLFRLMLRTSGGLADYTALSRECDISRQTVKVYLEAMSVACALSIVPPYPGGRNYLVCPGIRRACERRNGALAVRVTGARDLLTWPAPLLILVSQANRRRVSALQVSAI